MNNLFIFSKLREARSRLYRRQILQVNIRWKALDEIYKMYILLHRSDLKKIQQKIVIILVQFNKLKFTIHFIRNFMNFCNFDITVTIAILFLNFDENFSEFHRCVRKCQKLLRIVEKLQKKL